MTHDVIKGTPGRDFLKGTDGRDVIQGRGGSDFLFGLDGNDDLWGGERPDFLTGGDGADTFHFMLGSGIDFVIDLDVQSHDRVVLYDVRQDDIDTQYIASLNTTILTVDVFFGGTIIFVGESETDVLSALTFPLPEDYLV